MTANTTAVSQKSLAGQSHATRSRIYGVVFLLIAVATYWLFANGVDSSLVSEFGLNQGNVAKEERLPDWVVPSYGTVTLLAVVAAGIGGYQLAKGFGRATIVVLGLMVLMFIFSFLVWATRDQSINLAGMLKSTLLRGVPITLGALSGLLCERAGVVNIAIEGLLLSSAMVSTIVGSMTQNLWWGLLAGVLTGATLASVHAV